MPDFRFDGGNADEHRRKHNGCACAPSLAAHRARRRLPYRASRRALQRPQIFTDYHHTTALLRFAQALTSLKLALAPLVAGAAAVLAVTGRTRQAIGALAALELLEWMLQDVWSIPFHGLELSLDFGGLEAFFHHFVFPAAAIADAALALKDRGWRSPGCWSACRR